MGLRQQQVNLFQSYLLVLVGLAIVFTITSFLAVNYTLKLEHDSRNINLAGMQRMLSQKMALHAEQINHADIHQSLYPKKRLLSAAVRFLENHKTLTSKRTNPNLSDHIHALYFSKVSNLDEKFRRYANDAILVSNGADLTIVWQYSSKDIESLLAELDNIVSQFEQDASNRVGTSFTIQLIAWLINLTVIIIASMIVVRKLERVSFLS